jgi:hypothetical protein
MDANPSAPYWIFDRMLVHWKLGHTDALDFVLLGIAPTIGI